MPVPEEEHGAPNVEQASHEHALRPPELDDLALWDLEGGGVLTSHQSCPIVFNINVDLCRTTLPKEESFSKLFNKCLI